MDFFFSFEKASDAAPWTLIAQLEIITWRWTCTVSSTAASDSRSTWEYLQRSVKCV